MFYWIKTRDLSLSTATTRDGMPIEVFIFLEKKLSVLFFFFNLGCSGQRSVDTRISTNLRGHATPYWHVYHDRHKALPWIGVFINLIFM